MDAVLGYKGLRQLIKEELSSDHWLLEAPDLLDEKSIMKNKHPFKAVFMFGPAGAGKGYILKNVLTGTGTASLLKDFATANPDDRIEDVFPTFGISMKFVNSQEGGDPDLENIQQTARKILQNASGAHTANLLSIANPIIFDTTGEDVSKMVRRIKRLAEVGYDIAVMIINVPTQASVDRDTRRDRTVGKIRTTGISQQFQQDVVKLKKYQAALKSEPNVTMLVDEPYNNIFNLNSGELLQKPTPITPDMLPDDLNPEKNPEAFSKEKAKIAAANSRLEAWTSTPVKNPAGQVLLKGMRALVKKSGGRLGQNLNDLVVAMLKPELQSNPDIAAAAKHLAALGGESFLKGSIRSPKPTGDQTIRQMAQKESFSYSYEDLLETIRDIMGE